MKSKITTVGRVKEWHLYTIILLSFGAFLGIAYEASAAIAWAFEKLFN